jgi:hypothetical protein
VCFLGLLLWLLILTDSGRQRFSLLRTQQFLVECWTQIGLAIVCRLEAPLDGIEGVFGSNSCPHLSKASDFRCMLSFVNAVGSADIIGHLTNSHQIEIPAKPISSYRNVHPSPVGFATNNVAIVVDTTEVKR